MRKIGLLHAVVISVGTLVLGLLVGLNWPTISFEVANTLGLCDATKRQPLKVCINDELDFSELNSLYQELALEFHAPLDKDKLLEGAKRGLVAGAGDPYTVFMNREEAAEYRRSLSGDVGFGIGVEIGRRGGKIVILRVVADNPAERAGLKAGDVILKVDDKEVGELGAAEAAELVRGANGSEVRLTVERNKKTLEFTLRRERINNPSVLLEYNGKAAIVRVTRFDKETAALLTEKVQALLAHGSTGLILDLRGNGGGYVDAALDTAGLWLDNQVVMTEQARFNATELRSPRGKVLLHGLKTVVLVDGGTASAAEIVAGALQHYQVATLLGEESYGKGSVQKMVDLPRNEMLKVTSARWLLPSGLNLAEAGLTPDQVVEMTLEDLEAMRDPQLQAALEALK
jgi:carboxyl-terminal processing protease